MQKTSPSAWGSCGRWSTYCASSSIAAQGTEAAAAAGQGEGTLGKGTETEHIGTQSVVCTGGAFVARPSANVALRVRNLSACLMTSSRTDLAVTSPICTAAAPSNRGNLSEQELLKAAAYIQKLAAALDRGLERQQHAAAAHSACIAHDRRVADKVGGASSGRCGCGCGVPLCNSRLEDLLLRGAPHRYGQALSSSKLTQARNKKCRPPPHPCSYPADERVRWRATVCRGPRRGPGVAEALRSAPTDHPFMTRRCHGGGPLAFNRADEHLPSSSHSVGTDDAPAADCVGTHRATSIRSK
jgi:hypothetical protein